MPRRKRDILERAVRTLAEQAAKADELVDAAAEAGGGSHPVTIQAKRLRLELLDVKADLERELGRLLIDCSDCGRRVRWVAGLGIEAGQDGPPISDARLPGYLRRRQHEVPLGAGEAVS